MKLYLSHNAPSLSGVISVWFIVEPRESPEQQIASLLAAHRTVLEVDTDRQTLTQVEAAS